MQLLAQTFEAFKTKLSYLEQNELSKNFGEALDRLHQFVQDNFGFSFSKLFVYDLSLKKLNV